MRLDTGVNRHGICDYLVDANLIVRASIPTVLMNEYLVFCMAET